MRIPLPTQSYKSRSVPFSAQRLVNWILQPATAQSKSDFLLYPTPGLLDFSNCSAGAIRGMLFRDREDLYVVAGPSVYRVNTNGVVTEINGAVAGTGPVTMEDSGTQIVVQTSTGTGYVVSGLSISTITDPDFPQASSVAYLDGYFIFTRLDSGQWFISDINNASAFDALDFATAESAPDDVVRAVVDHRELFLFGRETTEVWVNSGTAAFPFTRQPGVFIEKGTTAPFSIAKGDNSIFWLGNDRIVYRIAQYQPQRISDDGMEAEIQTYSTVDDAEAWTYVQAGHVFYVLTFPTADATFVYDCLNQRWHERMSGVGETGRWRVRTGVRAFGKTIVGDYASGKLYELREGVWDEAGEAVRHIAVLPPITAQGKSFILSDFELQMDVGHGLTTGQGSDPQIIASKSKDGGYTWGNEFFRSMGKQGEYHKRVRWNRFGGKARQMTIKLSTTDPVKQAIIAAEAEVEVLAH